MCSRGTDSNGKRRLLSINTIPSPPTVEKDATGAASLDVSKGIDNDLLLEYKDEKGRVSKARGIPEKKSCWTCKYQQIAGNNFFGTCTYFSKIGRPNKDIPRNIVDEGCKFWIPKSGSANGKGSGSQ